MISFITSLKTQAFYYLCLAMRQNILYNISETEFLIWCCQNYNAELDSHQQIKYNYLKTISKYSDSTLRISLNKWLVLHWS